MNELTRGRPQRTSGSGLTAEQWLKGFLSGGSRPSKEIERVGADQGFSLRTLRRAANRVGSIKPVKIGFVFHWKDTTVADRKPTGDTQLEKLTATVSELVRLGQAPRVENDVPAMPEIDPNATDEDGFLLGTQITAFEAEQGLTKAHIGQQIREWIKSGVQHADVVAAVLPLTKRMAVSESELVQMMRAHGIHVPSRKTAPSTSEYDPSTDPFA